MNLIEGWPKVLGIKSSQKYKVTLLEFKKTHFNLIQFR